MKLKSFGIWSALALLAEHGRLYESQPDAPVRRDRLGRDRLGQRMR